VFFFYYYIFYYYIFFHLLHNLFKTYFNSLEHTTRSFPSSKTFFWFFYRFRKLYLLRRAVSILRFIETYPKLYILALQHHFTFYNIIKVNMNYYFFWLDRIFYLLKKHFKSFLCKIYSIPFFIFFFFFFFIFVL
jgi:hypothetical protein